MSRSPLRIRAATPQDCHAITDLHTCSRADYYRGVISDAELVDATAAERRRERWARHLRSGEHTIFLAEWDGTPVGFAQIGACRFPDPDPQVSGELHMYVDPGSFRRGVGTRLHTACIRARQQVPIAAARLWVQDFNTRAQAFYRAQDWRPDGYHRPDSTHLIGYRLTIPTAGTQQPSTAS
ncbi:GNAT family N-acetyltransferase [Actinomadura napierensis]|uniref:N-acetyltransferase domain-containing protein n=1 Tax=Actinomadura napierensis TaxID=267854 RepID=A0ABN2ZKN7_9ACTN